MELAGLNGWAMLNTEPLQPLVAVIFLWPLPFSARRPFWVRPWVPFIAASSEVFGKGVLSPFFLMLLSGLGSLCPSSPVPAVSGDSNPF